MYFKRIYDSDLAQASYIVGCQKNGTAIVIDPARNAQQYVTLAQQEGLIITHVTETHIHADYLSGARELAEQTGAALLLSAEGSPDWSYTFDHEALHDGDSIALGNITLKVLHTPGHTPEHLSFLITDGARGDQPSILLTGDFVFVGDLGRPDLLDEAAGGVDTRFEGAKQMFASLRGKFLTLPDFVQVWPGHGSGSACGKALGAVESTTVGYERALSWWSPLVQSGDESAFVDELLSGQPDAPAYFGRMKMQNKAGPALLGTPEPLGPLSPAQVQQAIAGGARVLDTRSREDFQQGALPGSIHLPAGKTFETWAGWLLDPKQDYVLVAGDAERAEALHQRLWMVGVDHVAGFIASFGSLKLESQAAVPVDQIPSLQSAYILDVRAKSEYAAGHLPEAHQLHAGRLMAHLDELPRDKQMVVHCQSGARSAAAVSLLRAEGFDNVTELAGGYEAWARQSEPVG
ncbi:MBL fold metallo-hydrolase (plasmid) [Deinococcus psychrotolerans]|uniref:MBL fold metallo-hydrolase n=1 Tax=Deinococcus psychrotolerans TaxID=2489213 RepID=A0A3G8YJN8_9DEIO|nr:MBL fold metallo-hydrolase [Deinococcus psychrotolerans]AZI44960.1 MBL fold metallo-hydrolase [Deinococcus psychrotolerans]